MVMLYQMKPIPVIWPDVGLSLVLHSLCDVYNMPTYKADHVSFHIFHTGTGEKILLEAIVY
jgi:hypothetical protein